MLSVTAEPSVYLNFDIRSMERFEYSDSQSQPISQITMAQKPHQFYLTIHLKQSEAHNFYLNAKSRYSENVVLVFDHLEDTRRVGNALSMLWSRLHAQPAIGQAREPSQSLELGSDVRTVSEGVDQGFDRNNHEDDMIRMASDAVAATNVNIIDHGLNAAEMQPTLREASPSREFEDVRSKDASQTRGEMVSSQINGRSEGSRCQTRRATAKGCPEDNTSKLQPEHPPARASKSESHLAGPSFNQVHPDPRTPDQQIPPEKEPSAYSKTNRNSSLDLQQYDSNDIYDATPNAKPSRSFSRLSPTSNKDDTMKAAEQFGQNASNPMKLTQQMRDRNGRTGTDSNDSVTRMALRTENVKMELQSQKASNHIPGKFISETARSKPAVSTQQLKVVKKPQPRGAQENLPSTRPKTLFKSRPTRNMVHAPVTQKKNGSATQASSSNSAAAKIALKKPVMDGRSNVFNMGSDSSRRIPEESVDWGEAYGPVEEDEFSTMGKATKTRKGRKPAANQKRSRTQLPAPRPPKAKAWVIPLRNQKPRRGAAVKANQAIQGIAVKETEEQLGSGISSETSGSPSAKTIVRPSAQKASQELEQSVKFSLADQSPVMRAANVPPSMSASPDHGSSNVNKDTARSLSTSNDVDHYGKLGFPTPSLNKLPANVPTSVTMAPVALTNIPPGAVTTAIAEISNVPSQRDVPIHDELSAQAKSSKPSKAPMANMAEATTTLAATPPGQILPLLSFPKAVSSPSRKQMGVKELAIAEQLGTAEVETVSRASHQRATASLHPSKTLTASLFPNEYGEYVNDPVAALESLQGTSVAPDLVNINNPPPIELSHEGIDMPIALATTQPTKTPYFAQNDHQQDKEAPIKDQTDTGTPGEGGVIAVPHTKDLSAQKVRQNAPEIHNQVEKANAEMEQPFFEDAMAFTDDPHTTISTGPLRSHNQNNGMSKSEKGGGISKYVQQRSSGGDSGVGKQPTWESRPPIARKLQDALADIPQLRSSETAEATDGEHNESKSVSRSNVDTDKKWRKHGESLTPVRTEFGVPTGRKRRKISLQERRQKGAK